MTTPLPLLDEYTTKNIKRLTRRRALLLDSLPTRVSRVFVPGE